MQGTYIQEGREIDYTPTSAVVAGQVVVQANLVGIAKSAIAANALGALSVAGIFDVDQNAEIIPAGSGVYWDADGNSVSGTAGAGAATATATGNTFMGFAQALTAATDSYVRIALRGAETAAAGVATATSITGTASTLPIAGLAVATGTAGAVSVAGGAGTADNANGGAVSVLGGNANGSGTDGALNLGTSNTSAVNVGAAGIVTAVAGSLQVRGTAAVTATVGGGTNGLIPAGTSFAIVTSDTATKQISLPAASVGDVIKILVTGAACELISAVTAHKVNEVTVGETNELALVQDSLYTCIYVATNKWIVTGETKLGAREAALVPDTL
jgi:predicted RecA/RadA family phage recombinase